MMDQGNGSQGQRLHFEYKHPGFDPLFHMIPLSTTQSTTWTNMKAVPENHWTCPQTKVVGVYNDSFLIFLFLYQ